MKKQTLLRILFVLPLLLSTVLFSTQLTNAEAKSSTTCSVYPKDGQVFSLADCDSFQFVSGWVATDLEMIDEFQNGALVTVTVKGGGYSSKFSPEVVNTLWADPERLLTKDLDVDCPSPYVWVSDYYLPLGSLEPGIYKTKLIVDPMYPLTDGFADYCTWIDGSLITELPALYTTKETYTNTFEVTP